METRFARFAVETKLARFTGVILEIYPAVPRPRTVEVNCEAKKLVDTREARFAVETRFAKFAVETRFTRFAVETREVRFAVETTPIRFALEI